MTRIQQLNRLAAITAGGIGATALFFLLCQLADAIAARS